MATIARRSGEVNTTHCTVCMLEFHTRDRVLAHIMDKSPICLQNLVYRGRVITDDEAIPLDVLAAATAKQRKKCAVGCLPSIRLYGPVLPVVQDGADGLVCRMPPIRHPLGPHRRWL